MGLNNTKLRSPTKNDKLRGAKKENKYQVNASYRHGVVNLSLIWVAPRIEQEAIVQLKTLINRVEPFTDARRCVDHLRATKAQKILIVVDASLARTLLPKIHALPCINSIYLIRDAWCNSQNEWTSKWSKVRGVCVDFQSLYETLKLSVKTYDDQAIAISFSPSNDLNSARNQNELQASFMYTQLFKNILLEMNHTETSRQKFMAYCRVIYSSNREELDVITEFNGSYQAEAAIWWYTRECFIYQMLNRALRLLQADVIVNMGFFISDLHHRIERLHQQQLPTYRGKTFLLFRGQAMSMIDFEKLRSTQGGLMSFNNFLSTSKNPSKSLEFAEEALENPNNVGILFILTIDPSLTSTPFADIKGYSFFEEEQEVLFSMHTVFRIGEIIQSDKGGRLFKVQLRLTADDDEELRRLTHQMEKEVGHGTAWQRLGTLLIQVGQVNKAEELCLDSLEQVPTQYDTAYYNHQLGRVKIEQGAYREAIEYHQKALEIEKEKLPPTHPMLVASYISLGLVCSKMGEHSKALNYHNQALEIQQKTLPDNHPDLATSYNNVGLVCSDMGKFSEALNYFEKALHVDGQNLPANHPSFASSYNNIGSVHCKMGDYQKALSHHNQALGIQRKTLPSDHPAVATSLSNVGLVYYQMAEYTKALSCYNEALVMRCKILPANHPDLAKSYDNIGLVQFCIGNCSDALSYYQKALAIRRDTLHTDHPDLASSFSNIGSAHRQLRNNSEALIHFTKALEIEEKVFGDDHPELATSYSNIATIHFNVERYADALKFYEKARNVKEKMVPIHYASLASCYSNIGLTQRHLKAFPEALASYGKALALRLKHLPNNYSDLAGSYNSVGLVYYSMKEYPQAIDAYEKSSQIQENHVTLENAQLASTYNHLASAYYGLKEYSKALSYYEKAATIREQTLPSNHAELAHSYSNIGLVHRAMKDIPQALLSYQRASEILEKSACLNDKQIDSIRNTIERLGKR